MSSLDGLNYSAFAPHVTDFPTVADYFGQGQQLSQGLLDQQYQAQTRRRLLEEQDQKIAMENLLGPVRAAQADYQMAGYKTPTYNPDPISGGPGDTSPFPGSTASTPAGTDADLPSNSSSPTGGALFGVQTVRQTTYAPGETHSDPDTDAGRTATGGPLVQYKPGMAGTAAVDPTIIPYGSIIQRADGSTYVAADTGGAVVSRKASQGNFPVIDFHSTGGNVPDYGAVKILPPTADYLKLSPAEKLVYHANAASLASGNDTASGANSAPLTTGMGIRGGGILSTPFQSSAPVVTQRPATIQGPSDSNLLPIDSSLFDLSTPSSPAADPLFAPTIQATPVGASANSAPVSSPTATDQAFLASNVSSPNFLGDSVSGRSASPEPSASSMPIGGSGLGILATPASTSAR